MSKGTAPNLASMFFQMFLVFEYLLLRAVFTLRNKKKNQLAQGHVYEVRV